MLEPVSAEHPCGEDLEYDPAYMELFTRLVPKERKVVNNASGNVRLESELEPVRWAEVERDCRTLLHRSKDVRLLLVFVRCRTQQGQAQGLVEALTLLLELLRGYPEDLYPRLDSDGEYDPLARTAALSALAEQDGLLSDIRGLSLTTLPGLHLNVRDVERSYLLPRPEGAPLPELVQHQLEELRDRHDPQYGSLLLAAERAHEIDGVLERQLGDAAPSLLPLLTLLDRLLPRDTIPLLSNNETVNVLETEAVETKDHIGNNTTDSEPPRNASSKGSLLRAQDIPDRKVARDQLRELRFWFEEHEPSSPISLLLRQAELSVGKRFPEIVHLLPQELMEKWENDC